MKVHSDKAKSSMMNLPKVFKEDQAKHVVVNRKSVKEELPLSISYSLNSEIEE